MGFNPKDPLLKAGPDQQREVFNRFCQDAHGFSTEDVLGASLNVLVNGIRQAYTTREKAHDALREKFAHAHKILDEHYDSVGRKKGIFPYAQTIHMAKFE